MKTRINQLAVFILVLVSFINVVNPIKNNLSKFTEHYNPKVYERAYNLSQYVIPQSKNSISDETLLSYAGYRYATGLNPVLINSDHPPLGKYIIGWITLLTGNNRIVSIVFAFGNLVLIYYLIYLATKSSLLSSLGILFLTFDSMFIDQIIHSPILDIIQVFFLLLYFVLFALWINNEKKLLIVLMGLSLGAMSSVKIYFPVIVVLASTALTLLLLKKSIINVFKILSIIIIMTGLVYTASYLQFFLSGNSLRSFLGTQKWIFLFWKNNSVQSSKYIGDFLTLTIFNQWKVWWGDKTYIQFVLWNIMWPIFLLSGVISSVYFLFASVKIFIMKKIKTPKMTITYKIILSLSSWIVLGTIYLSLLPISPRYIMIVYFPIYILLPSVLQLLVNNLKLKKYV